MKAVALLSGGLDSTLAARVILDQGIELVAVNFLTVFCNCTHRGESCLASKKAVDVLGVPLQVFNVTEEFLDVVKHPKHGYGSNMNPCIDCRIFMLKKAKAYMEEIGASFLITGEVLGQRPMSQRRDAMRLIEKESGVERILLRPLSARFFPATVPEERGWVDREKLLGFSGRSRKPQMKLAEQYGIRDYPCPAGGCLLTDPAFARRIKDLMTHNPGFTLNDVHLLKMGRHFRLGPRVKLIVGRNEEENQKIETFSRDGDVLLKVTQHPGPLCLLREDVKQEEISRGASVAVRYSKAKDSGKVEVRHWRIGGGLDGSVAASSIPEEALQEWMIGE